MRETVAYPAQLIVCARPWAEPICSAKIRTRKGADLANMIARHSDRGGSVSMVTLTSGEHHAADPLAASLGLIRQGWQKMTGAHRWTTVRRQAGIWGSTVAYEFTHGAEGWHPHLHVLLWHADVLRARQLASAQLFVQDYWGRTIAAAERYLNPRHGLHFAWNADAAALGGYVTKVQEDWGPAQEMTRGDVKAARYEGSRTPFGILADHYRWGDLADWALWAEYLEGVKIAGTRSIPVLRSTPGLRRRVFGDEAEPALTDEQMALVEVGGYLVAVIAWQVWLRIRQAHAVNDLLCAAERGGLAAINELLAARGLGWADSPD